MFVFAVAGAKLLEGNASRAGSFKQRSRLSRCSADEPDGNARSFCDVEDGSQTLFDREVGQVHNAPWGNFDVDNRVMRKQADIVDHKDLIAGDAVARR